VPDEENFFDLRKSEHGLTPVATDVWEGFIFINLDPHPQESLTTYLGGVAEQLQGGAFHKLTLAHSYKVEEQANWKIVLDAQNEVYHLPFQHRSSFPDFFVLKDNHFTRLQAVKLYNHHSVYSCELNLERQVTPLEVLLSRLDSATTTCRLPLIGGFDFYTIFPNFTVLLFTGAANDFCMTYNLWPLAVDRTVWEIRVYFPSAANVGQRINQEYMKCRIRNVLQEDAKAHETLHAGLASRAKTHLLLQDDEIQIRYFHKVLEDYVGFDRGA
jgi:phenylpropionate dioxygenase-like ring-hydroxylating dioxygenase large terminal subunit